MQKFRFILICVWWILFGLNFSFTQNAKVSHLFISGVEVKRITEERPVLSVWIGASEETAESVKVSVPYIISEKGERIKIDIVPEPEFSDIPAGKTGRLFNLIFDTDQLSKLESGTYTAIIIAASSNHPELKENLSFEIKTSASAITFLHEKVSWIKENIFSLLFSFLEMIGVILIIIILIRIFRNLFGGKKALRILPIIDETGKGSEYTGIASGIDDLLQCKIQEVLGLINESFVSRSALSGMKNQPEKGGRGLSSSVNILKGSEDIDPQKIGDLGVGIFKIPLGSLITVISKMFGGTYVTGALQKYSSTNKLILSLEQRTFLSLKKKSVVLFEGSWSSENLADGILSAIEELAYRIIIHLSKDINTTDWKAYKHFLYGNVFFSGYEKNISRVDLLRDAIDRWRESVRNDPHFAETHYNLGVALDRDYKIPDALFRYNKAVEYGASQTKVRALINIARIYIQDIINYDTARRLISEAKKLNSSIAELWNLEGLIYLNEQKDSEASACFQSAINCNKKEVLKNSAKEEPIYYYNLSVASYYLKNYVLAETSGLLAYRLYSQDNIPVYLLQTLGVIYNMKSEYQNALRFFEEGLNKDPNNRDMLDGYSTSLYNLKRYDESFAVNKRLLRLFPEYSNGYSNFIRMLEGGSFNENIKNTFNDIATALRLTDQNLALNLIVEKYNKALLGSNEKNIYAFVLGGIYTFIYKNYAKAGDYFFTVSESDPEYSKLLLAETLLNHGLVLYYLKDFNNAVDKITTAIKLFTQFQEYDVAFAQETLARIYQDMLMINDADKVLGQAIDFYKKVGMIKKVSELYSDRASWLIDVSRTTGTNYYNEAQADCNEAIFFNSSNYQAYHSKGNILYNYWNNEEAIPQYEQSVEIYFDVPGTHYTIGLCHFYLGQYEEAIKKFETTIKLKKDYLFPDDMTSPDPYQGLALTYDSINQLEEAESILKKAINLSPNSVKYRLLLARTYKKAEKISEAQTELKYALSLKDNFNQPFRHLVLNELADLYLDYAADYEPAFNYLNEAINLLETKNTLNQKEKEELPLLKSNLGWAFYRLQRYNDARELLEKTLSSFIGNTINHKRMALLYQKLFETTEDKISKNDYRSKALEQWKIVNNISKDDRIKKEAEKNLVKLSE